MWFFSLKHCPVANFIESFFSLLFLVCRVPVGKRADYTKIKSKGFFPGAKVTRGKDWQGADQDGGDVGTLTAIIPWHEYTPRSGANVSWNILKENNYRTGYLGKVSFWFGLSFIIVIIIIIIIIIIIVIIVEGKDLIHLLDTKRIEYCTYPSTHVQHK